MRRLSTQLLATRKEAPADARTASRALLLRSGQLHQDADGGLVLGPLLQRVLRRLQMLVRGQLEAAGAQELGLLTTATDTDHVAAGFAAGRLASHRQLPQLLFQVVQGSGEHLHPGLLGVHGAARIQAQAFDVDADAAEASRATLTAACEQVLARCGVDSVRVGASGRYGDARQRGGAVAADGPHSCERLVAFADAGEELLAVSDAGDYAAAADMARARLTPPAAPTDDAPMSELATPGASTLATLHEFVPDVPVARMVKTLLYHALLPGGDTQLVAALCRGDRSLHEGKLARALGATEVGLADAAAVEQATGAEVGYAGPVGLPPSVRVVADEAVADVDGFVCGANRSGSHLRDVRWGRDVPLPGLADLDEAQDGDPAPDGGALRLRRGVEVARVCHRGTAPAEVAGLAAAGPDGADHAVWATSCRLDVAQLAGSVVEQHHDDRGVCWPAVVAPHTAVVITVRADDETQQSLAQRVCADLEAAAVDAVWDDRAARAGAKFADAELLGFPWRVTCGRDAADGRVELVARASGDTHLVAADEATRRIADAARDAGVPAFAALQQGRPAGPQSNSR